MSRILLIIDDCPEIARGLRRCLKHSFDMVHVATTAREAEEFLTLPADGRPTHLLCDYYLGADAVGGIDLLTVWRERYPHIEAAALFSGSELTEMPADGAIDRIFRKPLDVDAIEQFFARRSTAPVATVSSRNTSSLSQPVPSA